MKVVRFSSIELEHLIATFESAAENYRNLLNGNPQDIFAAATFLGKTFEDATDEDARLVVASCYVNTLSIIRNLKNATDDGETT